MAARRSTRKVHKAKVARLKAILIKLDKLEKLGKTPDNLRDIESNIDDLLTKYGGRHVLDELYGKG